MDGWKEAASDQKQYNARREVVLANSVPELKVLVEQCPQRQRDRL